MVSHSAAWTESIPEGALCRGSRSRASGDQPEVSLYLRAEWLCQHQEQEVLREELLFQPEELQFPLEESRFRRAESPHRELSSGQRIPNHPPAPFHQRRSFARRPSSRSTAARTTVRFWFLTFAYLLRVFDTSKFRYVVDQGPHVHRFYKKSTVNIQVSMVTQG